MIEFRLLGSIEAHDADGPRALGGHKQRAVLAILALHANEAVSLDRLIDGIWGSEAPRTASAYVHNCISRLRRVLGPGLIDTVPPGYVLRSDDGAIDVDRFERLVREARGTDAADRLALLTEGLALWRGPALADFAFDEFAQAPVQRLDELRFEAVEERIAAQLELGSHADVIVEIEALARAHRSRERLRYLQMLALYRSGRQVDALAVFQETRLALADELGLEPSEALKALERMILAHDPALEPAVAAPVTQGGPTREARRAVTVLVVEPALLDDCDGEAARSLGSRCLAVAGSAIERHGGWIEQVEGIELAGVFGLRSAHEDDALRAARAASEIRTECTSLGIDVRLGIELAASDVRGDDLDGEVLAAARSVKSGAVPQEILIGPAAFRVLSSAIDAVPSGDDGNHRLLALIDGAPAVRRRFDTVIVGREIELERLQARIEAVWESGSAGLIVLLGDPGVGKTRLAAALASRFDETARVLAGRCAPYGEGTAYLALAEVVRAATGPGDPGRALAQLLARGRTERSSPGSS